MLYSLCVHIHTTCGSDFILCSWRAKRYAYLHKSFHYQWIPLYMSTCSFQLCFYTWHICDSHQFHPCTRWHLDVFNTIQLSQKPTAMHNLWLWFSLQLQVFRYPFTPCYTYVYILIGSMTQLFVRVQETLLTFASPSIPNISFSTGTGVASSCVHTSGIFVTVMSTSCTLVDICMHSEKILISYNCISQCSWFSLQLHIFTCLDSVQHAGNNIALLYVISSLFLS